MGPDRVGSPFLLRMGNAEMNGGFKLGARRNLIDTLYTAIKILGIIKKTSNECKINKTTVQIIRIVIINQIIN